MVVITVTDPRIEHPDSMSSFTSYLVSTKQGNSVRRRYSDFQWLYHRLQTEIPGAIVPIIPHTRTLMSSKKFDLEFIEERRRNLQDFLIAIAEHSELCRAPSMTPFMLLALGPDFDEAKRACEQKIPSAFNVDPSTSENAGKSSQNQIKSATKGVTNFLAKVRLSATAQELLTSQDEGRVFNLSNYVAEIHGHVKGLAKTSEALLKAKLTTADAFNEVGIPVGLWRTTHTQQPEHADDGVKEMMTEAIKYSAEMSELLRKKHKEEEFLFGHTIQKLSNTVSAFAIALEQRKRIQMDYTQSHNALIEKNSALEKAQKNLKPPEVMDKLTSERVELEEKIENQKERFEEVTKRVIRDGERCKPKLMELLKESFAALAKAEIAYTNRINEVSQRMLVDLENAGRPQPPPSAPPAPPPDE